MSFITEQGLFCYNFMLFVLKNVGTTYQCLISKIFQDLLGKTMEFYSNDMLVKSLHAENHINHLRQSFDVLHKYNMKINPTKCVFAVASGKFLRYVVTK